MKVETAVNKLRGRGYKGTPQRLAVLEALAADQHQSIGELRERCPKVGMVTVYRTLDLLTEQGLVRRLDLGDGPRYELAEAHHHHLICEGCGDVSEFDQCPIDPTRLPLDGAFEINSHSVEVYGLCGACK